MPRIKANGIDFEYDKRGPKDGEPVLLVMGHGTQMINWPDEFCDAIADAGYLVVRFDNRDTGLSDQFDSQGVPDIMAVMQKVFTGQDASGIVPYILDDMAADAAAILDALDLSPAHIVGASMGGMIAQLMAIKHAAKVRSIIPIMSTSSAPELPQAKPETMAALSTRPESSARHHVLPQALKAQLAIGSHPDVRDSDDILLARIAEAYDRAYRPDGSARQTGAILAQPRWHEQLSHITIPTMVVHGVEDPLMPIAGGRDISKRIAGAKMVEIEKWGHDLSTLILPRLINHIVDFLATVKSTPAVSQDC